MKKHPGNTELVLYITDWNGDEVRMKSQTRKIELNDELIAFLQEHEEDILYSLDKV